MKTNIALAAIIVALVVYVLSGCGLNRMAEGINNEDGSNLVKHATPTPTIAP